MLAPNPRAKWCGDAGVCAAYVRALQLTGKQEAELPLTARRNHGQPYCEIASRFHRHHLCTVEIGDLDASNDRHVNFTLPARITTNFICVQWTGASWIIERVSTG
jgi:hypothetical protein